MEFNDRKVSGHEGGEGLRQGLEGPLGLGRVGRAAPWASVVTGLPLPRLRENVGELRVVGLRLLMLRSVGGRSSVLLRGRPDPAGANLCLNRDTQPPPSLLTFSLSCPAPGR